jgi:hypothetical protein
MPPVRETDTPSEGQKGQIFLFRPMPKCMVERHEKAQNRYDTLQKKRDRGLIQADIMSGFLFAITELDNLQLQFYPPLWHTTVDHVTVYADERLVFHFKNGSEVEMRL